ncbi:MAG TPA: TetR/AcrR family transcriptional regulator [Solimonas sp.]|nr:TetR/AcrR family transcriptional regulator [Solimonas sp.]
MSRISPVRRRPGRPKDAGKREAMLAAAKRLFAAGGLEGTSMDAIAAAAGVSKLTLYSHFANKDELFRQAVISKCAEYTPPELFEPHPERPLRARLLDIGLRFVQLVNSPDALNLYRMMGEDARRSGKLGKLFYAVGPQQTLDRFSALLDAAVSAGELSIPHTGRAATHFFCLLKGTHHLRALVGQRKVPPAAVLRAHVAEVVDLFLRAYAP